MQSRWRHSNFTGVIIRGADGQNKLTFMVDEYGRKRVRHWGEQIIRAGQESESWGMQGSKSKQQTNQNGSGKSQSQKKTRQRSYIKSKQKKGLGRNRKSNAKTVIHKSKKKIINTPPVTHQGSQRWSTPIKSTVPAKSFVAWVDKSDNC